jgi:hypothetical protein
MPSEERLVVSHVLQGADALSRVNFKHSIDEKKGVAVRKVRKNCADVEAERISHGRHPRTEYQAVVANSTTQRDAPQYKWGNPPVGCRHGHAECLGKRCILRHIVTSPVGCINGNGITITLSVSAALSRGIHRRAERQALSPKSSRSNWARIPITHSPRDAPDLQHRDVSPFSNTPYTNRIARVSKPIPEQDWRAPRDDASPRPEAQRTAAIQR